MTKVSIRPLLLSSYTIRKLVTFSAWGAIALLALSVSVVNIDIRNLTTHNQMLGQVNTIQLASAQLLSDLLNAETGQRGYLLTNDPAYLEPYHLAQSRLSSDFVHLRSAPLATPSRTAQIDHIELLASEKLAELARTIALHDSGQKGAAIQMVRTDYGKQVMDGIRVQVAGLQAAANAKLLQTPATDWLWDWVNVAILIPLATLLLAAVVWAKHRIEADIQAKFYRLKRFTRAFGVAKGTLRSLDGRILFWDHGAQRLYGFTAAEALGRVCDDLLSTSCSQTSEEIWASLLERGEWQGECTCRHKDGRDLHIMSDRTLSRGEAGEPDVVIEISTDITAMKLAEREREKTHTLLSTIMETAPGLIYAKDRAGRMIMANPATLELIGKPWSEVQGRMDMEFLDNRAQGARVFANDQRIMDRGEAQEIEEEVGIAADQPRVWSSIKAPLRDATATVVGLIGMSIEITDRKRTDERLQAMVNELNHRVKNTLATVQAIASQTLRGGEPALRDNLETRLLALAAAHDVLTRQRWEGASLHDLVAKALAPFGGLESGRFRLHGPQLQVVPRAALALAMGLNELGTNTLKFGALSTPTGEVEIVWEVTGTEPKVFRLSWSERGGPPCVEPLRHGFGLRLIQRTLAQDLGGTAVVRFDDPQGVRCLVKAPLAEVVAPRGMVPLLRVGSQGGERRH